MKRPGIISLVSVLGSCVFAAWSWAGPAQAIGGPRDGDVIVEQLPYQGGGLLVTPRFAITSAGRSGAKLPTTSCSASRPL